MDIVKLSGNNSELAQFFYGRAPPKKDDFAVHAKPLAVDLSSPIKTPLPLKLDSFACTEFGLVENLKEVHFLLMPLLS